MAQQLAAAVEAKDAAISALQRQNDELSERDGLISQKDMVIAKYELLLGKLVWRYYNAPCLPVYHDAVKNDFALGWTCTLSRSTPSQLIFWTCRGHNVASLSKTLVGIKPFIAQPTWCLNHAAGTVSEKLYRRIVSQTGTRILVRDNIADSSEYCGSQCIARLGQ